MQQRALRDKFAKEIGNADDRNMALARLLFVLKALLAKEDYQWSISPLFRSEIRQGDAISVSCKNLHWEETARNLDNRRLQH